MGRADSSGCPVVELTRNYLQTTVEEMEILDSAGCWRCCADMGDESADCQRHSREGADW
jgi:hypothetical protein